VKPLGLKSTQSPEGIIQRYALTVRLTIGTSEFLKTQEDRIFSSLYFLLKYFGIKFDLELLDTVFAKRDM
jgi:hypothetical protein